MGDLFPDEVDELADQLDDDKKPTREDDPYGAPPALDAEEEEKAKYVIGRVECQDDFYRGLHQQWTKVIYFLVNKHWLKYDESRGGWSLDTDVPEWAQQPVTNWTWAVYRSLLAKMTKQRPALEVIPPSGDTEDRESAKLGEALLKQIHTQQRFPQKRRRALGWFFATGNVFYKVDWDPNAGETRPRTVLVEVPDPENPALTTNVECPCDENGEPYRVEAPTEAPEPDPVTGEVLEPAMALDGGAAYDLEREPDMLPIGEITTRLVDPMSWRWNPEAREDEDDATEGYEMRLIPAAEAARTYSIEANELQKGGGTGSDMDDIQALLDAAASSPPDAFDTQWTSIGSSKREVVEDRVLEIKFYAKPNAAEGYPDGRHWIVCGGKKVWPPLDDPEFPNGEAPLPHGFWPPIVPMLDTPIPGQVQAQGVLQPVVPLNEKFNQLDGKIGEYHTMMAMGGCIFVHPEDRGMVITSEPGQVKPSKGMAHGHPPIREKLEALPAAVYAEREVIKENLQAIGGTSQLDMGQRPEGVTAGRAFMVIQEATDAAIGPSLESMELAEQEVGRRWLVLAQRYYDVERTMAIRGERGQWEFVSFTGADLKAGLDVKVVTGSAFPHSKSAQFDTRISIIEALPGIVTDSTTGQVDPTKLAKVLEPGSVGMSAFVEDGDADLDEIAREHMMFANYDPSDPTKSNQLPQLGFWQNQIKHQMGHFEWMKRNLNRFTKWSQPAQLAFIEHCRLTTEAVALVMQSSVQPPAPGEDGEEDEEGGAGAGDPAGGGKTSVSGDGKKTQLRLTRGDRKAAGQ